jgi:hypothetical protein
MVKAHKKTGYELLFKRKPLNNYFKPFGCSCTLLNTQDNLNKLGAVGYECFFVGYSTSQTAYRVYTKRTKVIQESYYVDCQEYNRTNTGTGPNWFYDVDVVFNTFKIDKILVLHQTLSKNLLYLMRIYSTSQPV